MKSAAVRVLLVLVLAASALATLVRTAPAM